MNLEDITRSASAIRLRQRLLPEGGPGDKIFPPTFAGGVYCWEHRRIDGRTVPCVLLDSVASQAARLEEALAEAVEEHGIELPRLIVKFDGELADVGQVSTLAAPHRVFDAILRDSNLNGQAFHKSALYLKLTASNVRNATELFTNSPNALLFGCWDSTGAAGGLGNKFARVITSEIVAINAEWGVTQGGVRQDPFGISAEVEIAIDDTGDWTLVGRSATGKKDRAKGTRPSEVNHGSILLPVELGKHERLLETGPIEQRLPLKGGITVDHALQTTVLSLTGLRRLKFPVQGQRSVARDKAAHLVLIALGLVAITVAREKGYWLRSRCGLVADGAQDLEIVQADGKSLPFACDSKRALQEYRQAVTAAKKAELPWEAEPVFLKPQQKLVDLIKKSREIQLLGK